MGMPGLHKTTNMHPSDREDPSLSAPLHRQRLAVLVVDVVESVRLMQRHEDEVITHWRRLVDEVRTEVLPSRAGRLVKSLGDGMLMTFESPRQAVSAALAIQTLSQSGNRHLPVERQILLRQGLHLADVQQDALDVFGQGVNVAARLAACARPGETLATAELVDAISPDIDAHAEDRGELFLKHIEDTVRAFALAEVGASNDALPQLTPEAPYERTPRIAVVPFGVLGSGEFALGDALADGLIGCLLACTGVTVLSRLSTQQLRSEADQAGAAHRYLDADYLLSGTAMHSGEQLRVRAQLTDAGTREVLWSGPAQTTIGGLFDDDDPGLRDLADAVSLAIAQQQVARVTRLPMQTLDGYALYMGGVSLLHRFSRPDFARAEGVLTHLSERVPRSAEPHAMLAKWHIFKMVQGWSEDRQRQGRAALDAARRAIDRHPDHALSLAVEGLARTIVEGDLDCAAERYRQAIECNANEAYAWSFLSGYLAYREQAAEAIAAANRAAALSPLDPARFLFDAYRANAYLVAGQYEAARGHAAESLRRNGMHTPSWRLLILALALGGRLDEARRAAQRHAELEPLFTVSNYLLRYPGRDAPHAAVFAEALREAGVRH